MLLCRQHSFRHDMRRSFISPTLRMLLAASHHDRLMGKRLFDTRRKHKIFLCSLGRLFSCHQATRISGQPRFEVSAVDAQRIWSRSVGFGRAARTSIRGGDGAARDCPGPAAHHVGLKGAPALFLYWATPKTLFSFRRQEEHAQPMVHIRARKIPA